MPDMIPVATQIQPPDPMRGINTLSGIIGLQQQRQALQTGAYQQQQAQAESQQAQQRNLELQKAQALVLEGSKSGLYDDGDGGLDRQRLANDILKVAPTYGQPIISTLLSQANEIVANKQAHQNLSRAQQQQMGSAFGALATKQDLSNSDFIDTMDTLLDQNRDSSFRRMGLSMLTHIPPNASPQQLRELARRWSIAATSPESAEAQSAPQTTTMQAPGGLQVINTNPQAPGGVGPRGAPMPQGIAPQIVAQPITGAPNVVGPSGQARPITQAGGGPNPFQPYPGQAADVQHFQQEVQGTRAAGDQAPTARNINAQILRLADNAKTGPGTEIWQHAVGALAAPLGLSPTASYQELGKFLEKNAIQNMQSMGGPPSDARLSAAAQANGSTSFSPEALKAVTKFNDATNTALMQYREGLDRTVGMGQNVDYTKLPAFKAAWARNFDVDVFRVENAIRDGDKAELAKIRAELGPDRLKALAEKRRNLTLLSQGQFQ